MHLHKRAFFKTPFFIPQVRHRLARSKLIKRLHICNPAKITYVIPVHTGIQKFQVSSDRPDTHKAIPSIRKFSSIPVIKLGDTLLGIEPEIFLFDMNH